MPRSTWTPARVARMRSAIEDAPSVSAAAEQLGISRGTIEGACQRHLGCSAASLLGGPRTLRPLELSSRGHGSELKRILFIPDAHRPYHDKDAYAVMLAAARRFKPHTLAILGDYADFYAVSSHDTDPRRANMLEQEVADVLCGLDELDALPGVERKIYVEGNHEQRLERYLMKKAPALFGTVSVASVLELERRGWEYAPYKEFARVGKLLVTHDLDKYGLNAVRAARADAEANIVIGHVHRMEVLYGGCAFGSTKVAACFGWLGSRKASSYKHRIRANREWTHGFGIGYMEPSGTVHLRGVPIIDGACCLNGELVRA